ncbi:hypothetical protein F5878DRAFT_657308 [Lentinula raphanica]|uniref:Uncharacterized protein n=1 Tax=Lentinula raphanica TaxID=153919 RepID=A0AA38PH50_9AGAR|nr:hypothetical protein F5878DRAFT_657308 [Lentinula raphanica]
MNEQTARLTDNYPNDYTDFYGSGTPCIFKTGPEWPTRKGPEARHFVREARHIHRHHIQDIQWTSLNPVAYANAGDAKAFCSFVLSIGVKQYSLFYDAAVAAAEVVHKILADTGFPTIEVAFVESVVRVFSRSGIPGPAGQVPVSTGQQQVTGQDVGGKIPAGQVTGMTRPGLVKTLGQSLLALPGSSRSIPFSMMFPNCGSRSPAISVLPSHPADNDTKRVVLLTCAHVAHPLSVSPNENIGQIPDEILALSNGSFDAAIEALKKDIEAFSHSVPRWKSIFARLGEPVEGEDSDVTASRKRHTLRVEDALERINKAKALHNELTQHHGTPDQRIPVTFRLVGWQIFGDTMYPQPIDRPNYSYPEDGLLQAYGVVEDAEFRNPQHLDIHNENCLLVVKNGMKTGTTFGRVNSLESFTHCDYGDNNTHHTFIEFAVYRYDHNHPSFSEPGDLGSIILARDGHIVGLLTGGAGLTTSTEITYITPYWWIEQQIKAKFPQSSFYEVVQ